MCISGEEWSSKRSGQIKALSKDARARGIGRRGTVRSEIEGTAVSFHTKQIDSSFLL